MVFFSRRFVNAGRFFLLLVAGVLIAFPVSLLLSWLSPRFSTIRNFSQDYYWGLCLLTWVCALNLILVALCGPRLISLFREKTGSQAGKPLSRKEIIFLVVVVTASVGLRLYRIDFSLQHDEWVTYFHYVRHGPLVFFTRAPLPNNQPLNSFLVWLSVQFFGTSSLSLRIPSIVFGSVSVAWFFLLARRFWRPSLAGLFTILFSLCTWNLSYSQEARGYALLIMLSTGAIFFFGHAMKWGRARDWIGYACCCVGAIYTVILGALLPAGVLLASLLMVSDPVRRKQSLGIFVVIAMGSLFLWAPLLPQMVQYAGRGGSVGAGDLTYLLSLPGAHLAPIGFQIGILGVILLGAISFFRKKSWLLPALVFSFSPYLLAGVVSPKYCIGRFALFCLPLIFLLLCEGVAVFFPAGGKRKIVAGVGCVVSGFVFAGFVLSTITYLGGVKSDYGEAHRRFVSRQQSGETVGLYWNCRALQYYSPSGETYDVVNREMILKRTTTWVFIRNSLLESDPRIMEDLAKDYEKIFQVDDRPGLTISAWKLRK